MPFVHQYGVDLSQAGQVLAGAAALDDTQRVNLQNQQIAQQQLQMALAARAANRADAEFEWQQENAIDQRQHGTDIVELQNQLLLQRDQALRDNFARHLQEQNDARLDLDDRMQSAHQKRAMGELDTADFLIDNDQSIDPDERPMMHEQVARQRRAILTQNAISAKSPWPPGEREGDVWELGGPGSGMWVSRKHDGDVSLIHRADQSDFKLADFSKLYTAIESSMTVEGQPPPDPAVIAAKVRSQIQLFDDIKKEQKGIPQGTPMPPRSSQPSAPSGQPPAPTGPTGPTTQQIAAAVQARMQRESIVPSNHWMHDVAPTTRYPTSLPGRDYITAAELAAIAIRTNTPIDQVIARLAPAEAARSNSTPSAPPIPHNYGRNRVE